MCERSLWVLQSFVDLDGLEEKLETASLLVLRHYERIITGSSKNDAEKREEDRNWIPISNEDPRPVKTDEQLMDWRRHKLYYLIDTEKARRAAVDTAKRAAVEKWRSGRERLEILAEHASLVRIHTAIVHHIEGLPFSIRVNISQLPLYIVKFRFWDQRVKNYKKDRERAARVAVELETHHDWELERNFLREENASIQNSQDIGNAYIKWLETTIRSHAHQPNQELR